VVDRRRRGSITPGHDPAVSAVSLPSRSVGPFGAVAGRAALACALLVLSTIIVYLGRGGYRDTADPSQPLSLLACAYYAAVTLSTTGYGDIVPVTSSERLINIVLITPIRVIFLILLIGTTLEVLTERTRLSWRISRWRSRVSGHTVIVGYGTKGRSAVTTLREAGQETGSLVIVDILPEAMAEANRAGLTGVLGDATRREVLVSAKIREAARLVIAVGRDDTAVLIALTARQLCPAVSVTASVREAENEPLLRQGGASQVVVSSDAAGRLLGMSTLDPGVGQVMAQLLDRGQGLDLTERPAAPAEIGRSVREVAAGVVAVLRAGAVLAIDDPRAGQLLDGDRIVLVAAAGSPPGLVGRAGPGGGAPGPAAGQR
jgi:voltage-gated potassium channel Kch